MNDTRTIKGALERAAKTVTLRPQRGQRVYRNVASLGVGTVCDVREAGRQLTLDVGKAVGGTDASPNPSMVLRSAMSGCVAIGIRQWAARCDVQVDQVEVLLETDVDARGQLGVCDAIVPGFQGVRMTITVASDASPETIEGIVAMSLKYSPLMDVFQNPQPVRHRLEVVAPDAGSQGTEVS